jgi:hypothetical protein
MKNVTYNEKQKLFTIKCGSGSSCLGLEVCRASAARLAAELGECLPEDYRSKRFDSAMALYKDYSRLVEKARVRNQKTGWRSSSELTPDLIGLEGKRVEVVHQWDSGKTEKVRFQVGKSTGWIPCHIALHNRASSGGPSVCLGKILSIRVIAWFFPCPASAGHGSNHASMKGKWKMKTKISNKMLAEAGFTNKTERAQVRALCSGYDNEENEQGEFYIYRIN